MKIRLNPKFQNPQGKINFNLLVYIYDYIVENKISNRVFRHFSDPFSYFYIELKPNDNKFLKVHIYTDSFGNISIYNAYYVSKFRYFIDEERTDFKIMKKTNSFYVKYIEYTKIETKFLSDSKAREVLKNKEAMNNHDGDEK